jgi:hypothetical protein
MRSILSLIKHGLRAWILGLLPLVDALRDKEKAGDYFGMASSPVPIQVGIKSACFHNGGGGAEESSASAISFSPLLDTFLLKFRVDLRHDLS